MAYEAHLNDCESALVEIQVYKKLRPFKDWHEDDGPVLRWSLPIHEPPYTGTPLDSNIIAFPEYYTHWTPILVPDETI